MKIRNNKASGEPSTEGRYYIESLPRHFIETAYWVVNDLLKKVHECGHTSLRHTHQNVLAPLRSEGSRLVDIARESGVSKNVVGQLASELEKLGYVEFFPDPTDGRAKILKYTEQGIRLQSDIKQCEDAFYEELRDILGAKKLASLRSIMKELSSALRE
jgi:DNA-binding MarR family transcriptional regulator